jgi:hypothetical protein
MAEDLQRVQSFVALLVRRERWLILLRVLSRLMLLGLLVLLFVVTAAALRFDRSAASAFLVLMVGVGSWGALVLPIARGWQPSGDLQRQARRVEGLRPELRGRLLTAVERVDGPSRGESAALLGLVVRRAAEGIGGLSTAAVHPSGRLFKLFAVAALLWLVCLPAPFLAPGGPHAVVKWWAAVMTAQAAVSGVQLPTDTKIARVGDLVLRYTYPAYTGLDAREVANSTGDASGPPGTVVEVSARSAEEIEAAGLVAYDERLDARVADGGRALSAQFAIRVDPGTYHLILYQGSEPVRSGGFAIEPEVDLAPEVMLEASSDVVEVAVDEVFSLQWRARDDYGVRSVMLEVDGHESTDALYRQVERRAEVFDRTEIRPSELGLVPGERVRLQVAAWDNDTVSGSKQGLSRAIEVIVLGARGRDQRVAARQAELKRLMLPVLARLLTDPWPVGDTSDALARWGEEVSGRYEAVYDAVERLWKGMSFDSHDAAMMERVLTTSRELIRYTQVAFSVDATVRPPEAAFTVTSELRDASIQALEDAILAFHRMEHNRALRDVAEQADGLEQAADQLAELLEQSDPETADILSRLDQLEQMLRRLMEAGAKLNAGGLQEYLNNRQGELSNLMEEIRKALASGDLDEARELMKRLEQQARELSQGIRDDMERRVQQGEESDNRAQELLDELERLEKEQRRLQSEVQTLRKESDDDGFEEADALWKRIEQKTLELAEDGNSYRDGLLEASRRFYEVQRAGQAVDDVAAFLDAVRARDLRGANKKSEDVAYIWDIIYKGAVADRSRESTQAPGPGLEQVQRIRGRVSEIQALLDQLEQASTRLSQGVMEQSRDLENQQRDLENALKSVQNEARELSQEFPVRPEGMEQALEEAGSRMEEAGQDLQSGRPMEAEGAQGVAAERIRDARKALERAQQQAKQQAQQLQQGNSKGDSAPDEGGEQTGKGDRMMGELEIPGREEFRTPEEYRRALLRGMEGEVPDEYRALKKRYYEELVHQ